jgi:hypothetical protein
MHVAGNTSPSVPFIPRTETLYVFYFGLRGCDCGDAILASLDMKSASGMSALPPDATKAYLFYNSEELLNAVTRDRKGTNLPLLRGPWTFQKEVMVGVQEPSTLGIDPEPILRGMRSEGYFIWRADLVQPFGTSQ